MQPIFRALAVAIFLTACAAPRPMPQGTGSSNGGNATINERTGEVNFLDLVRIPGTIALMPRDLPAYELLKKRLTGSKGYQGCVYMPSFPGGINASVADMIMLAVDAMRLRLVMNGTRLPDPGDRGVVVLPSSDRKIERFALQIIKSGELWVDGQALEKMTDKDIAAFLLHEGLIRLWYMDMNHFDHDEDGRLALARKLPTTDKIADIVNLTFSESRFAQNVSARSIASKFCEAGLRVTESPGKKRLVHLPLPNPATPHPIFPKQVYLFQNRDCSLRELHVVGSWQSKLLADASVQELSNLPGGALDGQGDDTRLHDRADSSYWKVWLFPGTKDPITENISKLGAFRTPAVKFTGTLDNLPIREAFRGKMLGTKHPPGNLFYMHGSGIESLWVASDANYPPDELLLGFSVWGAVKGRLEFTGDGGVIYQAD